MKTHEELEKTLILDTETTGLDDNAEVLQLSIINGNGKVVFNAYFKPLHTSTWDEAMKVNQIKPELLQDKQPISFYFKTIENLLKNADTIVGYNIPFDIRMLEQNGIKLPAHLKFSDVMTDFSELMQVRKEDGSLKRFRLEYCANFFGFRCKEGQTLHDSLTDVMATLYCYLALK